MAEKFVSVPVTIEAMQWDGTARGAYQIIEWVEINGGSIGYLETNETEHRQHPEITIQTLEGVMDVIPEAWVIRGTVGEFYPCRNDVFHVKYNGDFDAGRVK